MIVIDNKYEIGDIVFLKTDKDQLGRIVCGIEYCPNSSLLYGLTCGTLNSKHYDFEISKEADFIIKTTN